MAVTAHKRRIGYLYLYATLAGLWQILALTHILIICGLITLPAKRIDPTFIVGQKIVENPFNPLKIAIPALYGFQWCTWCVILVCMVSLRLEATDPTLGFEIQDPKQQRHSLNTRSNYASSSYPNINGSSNSGNSNSNNQRMNQNLFNFRQSVIAPMGEASSRASSNSRSSGSGDAGMDGHSVMKMNKGKEPLDKGRYESNIEMPQLPERPWVEMERRASSDSNAIFIPNDPRISQVVVTFKDDGQGSQQEHTSRLMLTSAPSKQQLPEATTIFITNHHYGQSNSIGGDKAMKHGGQPGSSQPVSAAAARGLGAAASRSDAYVLHLSGSGESLSDMIFNSTQDPIAFPTAPLPITNPAPTESPFSSGPIPSPQLPSTITGTNETAGFHPRIDDGTPNPARIRGTATKVSLTLSSDSFSSELSALSNASSNDSDDVLEFAPINTTDSQVKPQQVEGPVSLQHGPDRVVAGLAMTSVDPLHIIPKNQNQQQQQHETKSLNDPEKKSHQCASSHGPSGGDDYSPQAQPNSSVSSHSLSSLSSSSTRSRNNDRSECGQVFETADSKPISTPSSSPSFFQQPESISASAQAQAPPSFSYTPSPLTPFPACIGSVSVAPTTAKATSPPAAASRTKSHRVSLPLQYWRNRTSQPASLPLPSSSQPAENATFSSSSSPVSPPPQSPSSFTQNYITNAFLSKKKKFQIPTIIIHAADEDGKPPRVLSPQDIEYLTTMPPVPLRPLIQPWDDIEEDEDGVYDDEYDDYDDYPHPHHQPHHYQQQQFQQYPVATGAQSYDDEDLVDNERKEYSEREQTLMGMQSKIDEVHQQRIQLQQQQQQHQLRRQSQQQDLYKARAIPFNLSKDGSGKGVELRDNPYVLDVPIDL
ncbi:hypothetical protein BG015_002396, partial [Linnemannia schmuckeri]